ncbi:MAG: BMP family ABC transporter substrate-binding protein, partial [Candidatus Ventricola sp.]
MKKNRSMILIVVAVLVVIVVAAAVAIFAFPSKKDTVEIALVTDVGTIDDESFNQACWQGV